MGRLRINKRSANDENDALRRKVADLEQQVESLKARNATLLLNFKDSQAKVKRLEEGNRHKTVVKDAFMGKVMKALHNPKLVPEFRVEVLAGEANLVASMVIKDISTDKIVAQAATAPQIVHADQTLEVDFQVRAT
jgi:hypothetical protein